MNREYAEKVEVLLKLLPIVMDEKVFAVHGGSAINLFVRDLPRYSVDIDLTYLPLEGREESLEHINAHLTNISGGTGTSPAQWRVCGENTVSTLEKNAFQLGWYEIRPYGRT